MKRNITLVQIRLEDPLLDYRYRGDNLGLGYLSKSLTDADFNVDVINAAIERLTAIETINRILVTNPILVGFSVSAQITYKSNVHITKMLRDSGYQGFIMWGGHFATFEPEKILKHNIEIDAVIRGEGEETIVELCEAVFRKSNLSNILGLCYRSEENKDLIISTPNRPLLNFSKSGIPDRKYLKELINENRRISVSTGRGCYAQCSFCSLHNFYDSSVRRIRTPYDVAEEIAMLVDSGANKIRFVDDIFFDSSQRSKEWMDEFVREIKSFTNQPLNIWAQCRASDVEASTIEKLKSIGLRKLYLGIESINESFLERYNKGVTSNKTMEGSRIASQMGIKELAIGMIMFEPFVTIEELKNNLNFLKDINAATISNIFTKLIPYTGTPVRKDFKSQGILVVDSWDDIGDFKFQNKDTENIYIELQHFYSQISTAIATLHKIDAVERDIDNKDVPKEFKEQIIKRYSDINTFIKQHFLEYFIALLNKSKINLNIELLNKEVNLTQELILKAESFLNLI